MAAPAKGPSRRVLVVDDDEDSVAALVILLQHDGHDVRRAHDGRTALLAASDHRPDVVVLDICLRDMSGFELAVALRASEGSASSMLVALTGLEGDDVLERCRSAGIDRHLVKPIRDFPGFRKLVRSLAVGEDLRTS